MAEQAQVDLSKVLPKVVKKTAPLDELVAEDLDRQGQKFNLTKDQLSEIGDDRRLFGRRGLFRRRRQRTN